MYNVQIYIRDFFHIFINGGTNQKTPKTVLNFFLTFYWLVEGHLKLWKNSKWKICSSTLFMIFISISIFSFFLSIFYFHFHDFYIYELYSFFIFPFIRFGGKKNKRQKFLGGSRERGSTKSYCFYFLTKSFSGTGKFRPLKTLLIFWYFINFEYNPINMNSHIRLRFYIIN